MVYLTTKSALFMIATLHLITQAMDAPIVPTKSIDEIIQKNTLRIDLGTVIEKLAWSPDGNYIAGINTNNPSLIVWDTTGKKLWTDHFLFCHTQSISFSPDSNHIAAIGYVYNHGSYRPPYNPHYLKIVETTGKSKLRSNQFKNISCFAYSNDGKQIAMGVEEADFFDHKKCLKIIDTQTGKFIKDYLVPEGFISSLAYSHNGTILALCLYEKGDNIVLLNAVTGIPIKRLNHENESFHSLQFYHNDASKIISCSKNHCLLWDLLTGTIIKDFNKGDHGSTTFKSIALSKDNKKLITGKYKNFIPSGTRPREPYYCVTMFNTETGKVIIDFEKDSVNALAYSPDMKKIVLAKWLYTNIITLPSDEEIKELQRNQ